MFNVYKNQQSQQTGSRNLMGPKTLPTILGTYMKLVTKYQISAINSCWEKCDEKCTSFYYLLLLYPRCTKGEGVYCFTSVRPSVLPSVQDIFRRIFLSNCWWQKSDIWSQASYRYAILWEAFLDTLDSYLLFVDLVGFYTIVQETSNSPVMTVLGWSTASLWSNLLLSRYLFNWNIVTIYK
jgi:hypothetical protein